MTGQRQVARIGIMGAIVASAAMTGTAQGWNLAETGTGAPVRWFARSEPLPFHLGAIGAEELTPEIAVAIVETAWGTWRNAVVDLGCEDVPSARYAGRTEDLALTVPKTLREAPDNLVLFVRTAGEWDALGRGSAEIAVTYLSSNDETGEIADADIVVNDARFRLTIGGSGKDEVDFVAVMTHEVGHALGLLHSIDATATMYATYTNVDPLGARSLERDDTDGVCALYIGVPDHGSGRRIEGCVGGEAGLGALGAAGVVIWRRRVGRARMPGRS